MDKIIVEDNILFDAKNIEEGVFVVKGKSLTKVDEKSKEAYEVAKTFSVMVEGNREFIKAGEFIIVSEEVEKKEEKAKKFKVMYEANEMEIEAMDMDECKKKLMEMAKIEEMKK